MTCRAHGGCLASFRKLWPAPAGPFLSFLAQTRVETAPLPLQLGAPFLAL